MNRRFAFAAIIIVFLSVAILAIGNTRTLRVAYHQWRMEAEFETLFGNPTPNGGGLASTDVTGIDVDQVLADYEYHRQQLVELGFLERLQSAFPHLVSDGSELQAKARSEFASRMSRRFPGHQNYHLAGNGSFSTWVLLDASNEWKDFIKSELENSTANAGNIETSR